MLLASNQPAAIDASRYIIFEDTVEMGTFFGLLSKA
jgi:hypothetical protein